MRADLSPRQREIARQIFTRLAEAEAKVHGTSVEQVHFHEVGAADSIADIVGTAVGWDLLGVERLVASPRADRAGPIRIAHGESSVPAPATAELLRGVPLAASTIAAELTTPTGAAILATLAERFGPLAGDEDRADRLRGRPARPDRTGQHPPPVAGRGTPGNRLPDAVDQVCVLETNLDDTTGELIGYCTARLWEAGALDVYSTAIQMKKNRPGVKLTVLCRGEDVAAMEDILFSETTTLGVRRWTAGRQVLARQTHQVETPWGPVEGKIGHLGTLARFAPEYESCREVAARQGIPLRDVYDAAHRAFAAEKQQSAEWSRAILGGRFRARSPLPLRERGERATAPESRKAIENPAHEDMRSMLLAKFSDPSSLVMAAVVITAGLLLLRSNRYFARQKRGQAMGIDLQRPGSPTTSSNPEASGDMAQWEVHMHETARELTAQLDSKLSLLRALVAEADCAAARLEAALAAHQAVTPAAELVIPPSAARETPAGVPSSAPRPRNNDEIYTLADYGYEPAEIARRSGTPIGEVELILSLRPERFATRPIEQPQRQKEEKGSRKPEETKTRKKGTKPLGMLLGPLWIRAVLLSSVFLRVHCGEFAVLVFGVS